MDIHHFDIVCSICLENLSTNKNQTPAINHKEVWEKLSWCFQLTLNFEKELPYSFCGQCLEDLDTTYRFRTKCMNNHEHFKKYCKKNITASSEIEDEEVSEDSNSDLHDDNNSKSVKDTTFTCNICNKILASRKSLLKHIYCMHEKRHHTGKVTGFGSIHQYHCPTCSYSTPHSQTLTNHMRRHNGERPFKCDCGKTFTQTSSLAAHRKIHSSATYFTCTECGKQFKHAFSLKTHMKVHSNGTYSCHICNKVLKSKRTLASHLHRHYKIYNFNCENCGDTFVTSAELKNHKNKHNTVKNIVCHACNYATNSKKNLIAHLKRHEGEKACKCMFCEKAFITEANLRRHIRTHTREKPFTCTICTQRFAHSSSLNNHMLTLHGVKYKWADDKPKESKRKTLKITSTSL